MLLNAAKCQGYSFYRQEKTNRGGWGGGMGVCVWGWVEIKNTSSPPPLRLGIALHLLRRKFYIYQLPEGLRKSMVLGCERIQKPGITFSGLSGISIELRMPKVHFLPSCGNLIQYKIHNTQWYTKVNTQRPVIVTFWVYKVKTLHI